MKGRPYRWTAGQGLCVVVLAASLLLPAVGQQAATTPTGYDGAIPFQTAVPSLEQTHDGAVRSVRAASPISPGEVAAEKPTAEVARAGDLIAFSSLLANGQQQIVVIDATKHVVTVYRVLPDSGEISLVSVRNIRLDSSIDYFNSGDPSPDDIRKMQLNR